MGQKRLMLLGGISYLLPAIEVAHKHGYYVITVDYLPDNVAHKFSDEYHNVSIIEKNDVLSLARELKIDGIMSFAVDPGVVSASFVADQMHLPFQCSYESTCILQDKSLFRKFLKDNGFNVPLAKGYSNSDDAVSDVKYGFFELPVIVKPVDSAGSKGITKVSKLCQLKPAIDFAIAESHNGFFLIEDFLEKEGLSSGSECFVVDGKLSYNGFYDQYFDDFAANPFTPIAECWPSLKAERYLNAVKNDLQRLFGLLGVKTGLFNVEWRLCRDGKIYLMEVSPRAGGNRLAEILKIATNVDLIEAEVCKAVGDSFPEIKEPSYNGFYSVLVLHADSSGVFLKVEIDSSFKNKYVFEEEIRIKEGDSINAFSGANNAIGTLFLRFSSQSEQIWVMNNYKQFVHVIML